MLDKKWHVPAVLVLAAAALFLCFRNWGGAPNGVDPSRGATGPGASGGLLPPRPVHSADRDRPLIATQLAPGLEIEKGEVERNVIKGPVKVTGTLPPSSMTPLPAAKAGNEETFKIVPSDAGLVMGDFVIEAAGALATRGGVRFTGPIRLKYQGDVGQWYEVGSDSDEAYLFVSADGSTKLLTMPAGTQSAPERPPESERP